MGTDRWIERQLDPVDRIPDPTVDGPLPTELPRLAMDVKMLADSCSAAGHFHLRDLRTARGIAANARSSTLTPDDSAARQRSWLRRSTPAPTSSHNVSSRRRKSCARRCDERGTCRSHDGDFRENHFSVYAAKMRRRGSHCSTTIAM